MELNDIAQLVLLTGVIFFILGFASYRYVIKFIKLCKIVFSSPKYLQAEQPLIPKKS